MLALKTIGELVEDNHLHAYVLDCYGIEVFKHPDQTIAEICNSRGISLEHLKHNLHAATNTSEIDLETLESSPIPLVLEYLKHAHHIFVKKSLPYMNKLIHQLDPSKYEMPRLIEDLKLVFPLFAEDFIHHIYEEEDGLFHYVNLLTKVNAGTLHVNKVFTFKQAFSLHELAEEHEDADDEMRGIRQLTSNYTLGLDSDIHLNTIYNELRDFESSLVFHANVENRILFPKAIALEQKVDQQIKALRLLN